MTNEEEGEAVVEGFSLTGDEVAALKDKHFTIYAVPHYEEVDDLDNKDRKKKKLIIPVQLINGTKADWYANKTSQKVIMANRGRVLSAWNGYVGEFVTKNQLVGKDEKKVIYLVE